MCTILTVEMREKPLWNKRLMDLLKRYTRHVSHVEESKSHMTKDIIKNSVRKELLNAPAETSIIMMKAYKKRDSSIFFRLACLGTTPQGSFVGDRKLPQGRSLLKWEIACVMCYLLPVNSYCRVISI